MKLYAMMNKDEHVLSVTMSLEELIKRILSLTEDDQKFFDGYKPVTFTLDKDDNNES